MRMGRLYHSCDPHPALRAALVRSHKFDQNPNPIRHLVIGKTGHKKLAIGLSVEPMIENGENAAIGCRADQSSEALLQTQHCVGHLVF